MPPKNQSIREIGIDKYLDSTSQEHNNFGYMDLKVMVAQEVNTSNMARAFGVNRKTMAKWLEIYEDEENGTE